MCLLSCLLMSHVLSIFLCSGTRYTGPSFSTKVWVFLIKALTYKKPQLYSYQASLPRLPLPSLNQTLTRYLRSVKPLESEETYERLVREADEFENGIGKKLQLYLWLKSWWSSNYVRFVFDPMEV